MTTAEVIELTSPRPPWKWVGGKRQLIPELSQHVPRFNRYFEPFFGGGALFWHLAGQGAIAATVNDSNTHLIAALRAIQNDVGEVVSQLRTHERSHARRGKVFYMELRADEPVDVYETGARFITLMRLGFNGLWRVNRSGEFNVPYGKWASVPTICDEANLRRCSLALKGVKILSGDFESCVAMAKRGDFAYFDPPYWPVSDTADFTSYTKEGFGSTEQERLRDLALKLKRAGVSILLSNADVPQVRKLYAKGFSSRRVEARRNVNSVASKRGKVGELLIW